MMVGFLTRIYKYISRIGNTKATYIQQREFGSVFHFNDTVTSLSQMLSSSVTVSASENKNHNLSFSDNETLPDFPIKRKRLRRYIQPYVQRSSPRSNHLRAMTKNLTLLKMVEKMKLMIQKKVLKKQKKKENKVFTFRLTLKRRLQYSIL